jgi:hypothetical protein
MSPPACIGRRRARETREQADIAKVLTFDEARRIAGNVARLPGLLGATNTGRVPMTDKPTIALFVYAFVGVTFLTGCDQVTVATGDNVTSSEVEAFFRKHKVDGNHAVAMKKRSLGVVAYLGTIHGFPNNFSVCEEVLAPYKKDASLSTIPGSYFCEDLQ